MPAPFEPKTLYDALGALGGGVNMGDSPLDLPPDVMAGSINTTVSGKNVTHRPPYCNRPITWPSGVQQLLFQGCTKEICLDDTGNAWVIALMAGRVFSFGISGNTITCTELPIYSGTGGSPQPQTGGNVTGASIAGAVITGATISMSGTYTGTITGGTITGATLSGGLITAGTITGGTITSAANVSTTITTATISAGFVTSGTITGVTVTGSTATGAAAVIRPQAWLWQSECWVIIQDGQANPIVVNLNTQVAVRSNYGVPMRNSCELSGSNPVAPVGTTFVQNFGNVTNLVLGAVVTLVGTGTFQVTNIGAEAGGVYPVTLQTLTGNGSTINEGAALWNSTGGGIQPGRMGAYGMERNWMSIIGFKQFIALDLCGGASGTPAYNFRDAVLQSTENTYIVGGGTFIIPGNYPITAICSSPSPNAALGQGPILVFSHKSVFSCQAPVDRLTWQSLANPILTEAVISNGAKGQNSTTVANNDVTYRAVDGVRSTSYETMQQSDWGDVPFSFEVDPILSLDNQALLNFSSSIVFKNRLLLTTSPTSSDYGVYHQALVVLNFDPISSLRGKAPAVWDSGTWIGSGPTSQMQILQLMVGEVSEVERAFAFVLNTTASPSQIEFWEILPDQNQVNGVLTAGAIIADNDGTNNIPIPWQFDSASLRFGIDKKNHVFMYLSNGEIWVDNLVGTVTFQVLYKPDQFPSWTSWRAWQTASTQNAPNSRPAFLPRQGLGEPSPKPLDFSSNRPMRNGFTFQTRFIIEGQAEFLGAFFESTTAPMSSFAKIIDSPLT